MGFSHRTCFPARAARNRYRLMRTIPHADIHTVNVLVCQNLFCGLICLTSRKIRRNLTRALDLPVGDGHDFYIVYFLIRGYVRALANIARANDRHSKFLHGNLLPFLYRLALHRADHDSLHEIALQERIHKQHRQHRNDRNRHTHASGRQRLHKAGIQLGGHFQLLCEDFRFL